MSEPLTSSPNWPLIPGYEILGELGRGGMGIVYQARQTGLERIVAVKMVLAGAQAEPNDLARFRIEAAAVARIHHPHIVQIFEVGEVDGRPYFSLEYAEGGSLAQRLNGTPWPGRDSAELVEPLAQAAEAAHRCGIVHRDLKPANVLLMSDGTAKLTDFGLAKQLDGAKIQTETGVIMGTPDYMAPEQAGLRGRTVGPAADVYALGALLYELLTGRPPFRAATSFDTLLQVMEQEPAPPGLLNRAVERDLETICLKCLEKEPARRYASAEALADDLRRYLAGEPINTRSVNVLDRLARALGRRQDVLAFRNWGNLLLLAGLTLLVGNTAVWIGHRLGLPAPFSWASQLCQFAVIATAFWRLRRQTILPTNAAERQLWSIWIGYLLAMAAGVLVKLALVRLGALREGRDAPERWEELMNYPWLALLAGLGFFAMGGNFWGRCYAIGLMFLGVALLMALRLDLAPLMFGLLWGVTLMSIGLHLRRLAREGSETATDSETAAQGTAKGESTPTNTREFNEK